MFYQNFISPQVKRIVIISNKNGINELPNDIRLRILGNQERLIRSQILLELQPSARSFSQNENFVQYKQKTVQKLKLNFYRSVLFHTNTNVCLIYFGQIVEKSTYLRKTINEEIKITNLGQIANLKYILDSYGLSNLMITIFKVAILKIITVLQNAWYKTVDKIPDAYNLQHFNSN